MKSTTYIVVGLQVEGIHHWGNMPDLPELKPVAFLRNPHRHTFHITASKEVSHLDRDVEIILFKRSLKAWLEIEFYDPDLETLDFGPMSCEQIAHMLCEHFGLSLCSVMEDGENGAVVHASHEEPSIMEQILNLDKTNE